MLRSRRLIGLAIAAAIGLALAEAAVAAPSTQRGDALLALGSGQVAHLYGPTNGARALVVYLSGDGGWNGDDRPDEHARHLAALGFRVIGLDSNELLAACKGPCAPLAARLSANLVMIPYTANSKPILVGYSSGATLAYAAGLQDIQHRFAGIVTMGFCPDLDQGPPPCATKTFAAKHDVFKGWTYPRAAPADAMILIQGGKDHGCPASYVKPWAKGVERITVWDAAAATHAWRWAAGPDRLLPAAVVALTAKS